MGKTDLKVRGIDLNDLPDRHRAFVVEYCKHYNASEAARKVGYKNAAVMGRKLIDGKHHPKVARAIGAIQKKNLETAILTKDQIMQELSTLAMRDIIDLCDEEGAFIVDDMRKLPPHIRRCVDGVEIDQKFDREGNVIGQRVKLKLIAKMQAFDMLSKHLGLYSPEEHKVEHSMSWDQLFEMHKKRKDPLDVIEGKIAQARIGNKNGTSKD